MSLMKKTEKNQLDITYLGSGFYLHHRGGIVGKDCTLVKDTNGNGCIDCCEEDKPCDENYQEFQKKYGFNPCGKAADQVLHYLTAKSVAANNARLGELTQKNLDDFSALAQGMGIGDETIARQSNAWKKTNGDEARLRGRQTTPSVMENVQFVLAVAEEQLLAGQDPAAREQFAYARKLVQDHDITTIDIEGRILAARKNVYRTFFFTNAPHQKHLKEITQNPSATREFIQFLERSTFLAKEAGYALDEIQDLGRPRYINLLHIMSFALREQPPQRKKAEAAMMFARQLGLAIGLPKQMIEEDIQAHRTQAEERRNRR